MLGAMRWIFVVLAALVVFVATPAWGQTIPSPPAGKPSAADEAAAKRNFESGLKLYGEGSYGEALVAFEQSYRVGGRPSALKNVAQCHRNMKHFVEALEAYDALLERHEAALPAADKKAVQQALEELGVLTGTIVVTVNEADADIEIDGKVVARSPMTKPKRVAVASHTVRVTKSTFAPYEQQVSIASQEAKKLDVKLEPEKLTGHIVVREQSGRDVHVLVDGNDQGPAPWEGDVSAGEHTVEAKGARFASEARRIKVAAKERLDVALDAQPLTGHLRVTTIPATANITVDGKIVGSGAWEGDLSEGAHRIEVGFPNQAPQVRDVMIGRGQLVVQEIPVVAAIAGAAPPEYAGIYASFTLAGMLGSGQADNSQPPAQRSDSFQGAASAALRIGNAWDWYSAEGVAMFMLEARNARYNYTSTVDSRDETWSDGAASPSVFLGAAGRATSKHDTVRFTASLAPGIAIRTFFPRRDKDCDSGQCGPSPTNNNPGSQQRFVQGGGGGTNNTNNNQGIDSSQDFETTGYTTFALVFDAGVYFGSTPGTKFFLGVQGWIDFPPDTLITGPDTKTPVEERAFKQPGRGITFIDGPQFYIGPSIGLRFGH